jgi:hypothetical protein
MNTLLPDRGRQVFEASGWGGVAAWEEQASDIALSFDTMLTAAEKLDALPFTVGAGRSIASEATDGSAATVEVDTAGKPARLALNLVHLPSSRWKVDRIVLPDEAPDERPWGCAAKR